MPQNEQNITALDTQASDSPAELEPVKPPAAEEQLSETQLEEVTGGANLQGSRLESLRTLTVDRPEIAESTEERSI